MGKHIRGDSSSAAFFAPFVRSRPRQPQPPRRLELIKVTSPLRPSFTGTEPPGVRGRQARTFPRQATHSGNASRYIFEGFCRSFVGRCGSFLVARQQCGWPAAMMRGMSIVGTDINLATPRSGSSETTVADSPSGKAILRRHRVYSRVLEQDLAMAKHYARRHAEHERTEARLAEVRSGSRLEKFAAVSPAMCLTSGGGCGGGVAPEVDSKRPGGRQGEASGGRDRS